MVAVPLGPAARFVAVASPTYLVRYPAPRTPQDLLAHPCIRFRLASGRLDRWEFARRGQELAVDVPGTLIWTPPRWRSRRPLPARGSPSDRTAAALLASGALVQVLGDWCPSWPGLQLYYYPVHRHMTPALRAFVDMVRMPDHATRPDPDASPHRRSTGPVERARYRP